MFCDFTLYLISYKYAYGEGGWDELGDGDRHIYATDTMYKITNENLLYSTGNSTQCSVVT